MRENGVPYGAPFFSSLSCGAQGIDGQSRFRKLMAEALPICYNTNRCLVIAMWVGGEMENEIVLFESEDDQVKLNVEFDGETVWLTKEQMAALFGRDRSVISRHISNIFREGEILEEGNVHYLHIANSDKPVAFYNLNVIISVGYRVKSKRGVEFRRRRQAYFRQRFGRAHHHDRRVEARRERGHGSARHELFDAGVNGSCLNARGLMHPAALLPCKVAERGRDDSPTLP